MFLFKDLRINKAALIDIKKIETKNNIRFLTFFVSIKMLLIYL
jgi:hypothetical protein